MNVNLIRNGIIVSCQALKGEPMYSEEGGIMPRFAVAAEKAGAIGIRANGTRDINEIKEFVSIPVIGIIKREYEGYEAFITSTKKEIDELATTDCEVIAMDLTNRLKADECTDEELVEYAREKCADKLIMADISTLEEGLKAQTLGVDLVGTTLSGYTEETKHISIPNFELVIELIEHLDIPVVAEGGISTQQEANRMLELGCHSVVVGGAITRPYEITKKFVEGLKNEKNF